MEAQQLYTKDGMFVASVNIPILTPRAEVLMWGERVFVWNVGMFRYEECFALRVPVGMG